MGAWECAIELLSANGDRIEILLFADDTASTSG